MISIVAYGAGNISSIANMLRHVGVDSRVVETPEEIASAEKLVLPGVGHFDYGMSRLRERGLAVALDDAVLRRRVPCLGVCLGMQLMCRGSDEGAAPGLGWIKADVRRFDIPADSDLKVPHMGWNSVVLRRDDGIVPRDDHRQRFYFVHSYRVVCEDQDDVVATCTHGNEFVAAFSRDNIHGVQFHPEKSHRYGMALMRRFAEL